MNPVSLSSAPDQPVLNPRLVTAAHEFEASLMQELVKPLEEDSLFGTPEGSHGSNETLMTFGSQALAKALSDHGGLGIAKRVLEHFHAPVNAQTDETAGSHSIRYESPK